MLRRQNSKSSSRLGRRKSTTSVYTKQDHIDPDVARVHALAAATLAYTQAYARTSADMHRSNSFNHGNEPMRRQSSLHLSGEERQGLRRQQSVRFAGPLAVKRRQSTGTRAAHNNVNDSRNTPSSRPRALTNEVPVPAAYRPPSRSSSIGKTSIKGSGESYETALAAYDEYYTREDDVASTPSSYRRIRKSKSTKTLFSPHKSSGVFFSAGTPEADYNVKAWKAPWLQNQGGLKAPKSMSFLRGGNEHMRTAVSQDRDAAINVARDRYLHVIEQQRLRAQPSFLFRSRERREEKPFRHSVRSGSGSYGHPIGSATPPPRPKEGSLRVKARKASQTFKKKLKNLFRRSADESEATIPNQQVEARRSHGSSVNIQAVDDTHSDFLDIPHPDDATVSRVASRVPSLHTVASSQQLRSRAGSVRSLRSNCSDKSRVTSWTNTVESTATSRHAQAERERQRLSIIQENGTHVSTSSRSRPAIATQFSAYPAFHRPRGAKNAASLPPVPVDSQRVYSALMKRLDENSPKAKLALQHKASTATLGPKDIPPRSSSRNSSLTSRTPATIRRVNDESGGRLESVKQEKTMTSDPHDSDDVFSPKAPPQTAANNENLATAQQPLYLAYPNLKKSDGSILTPQELAARNEASMKPSTTLRETKSTFFGKSYSTIRRSTSPYRRALAEADYNPAVVTGDVPVGTPSQTVFTPPPVSFLEPTEVKSGERGSYTESVYSRTTSGRTPAAESSQSLAIGDYELPPDNRTGLAFVERSTYRPAPPKARVGSSTGSTEWQGWLSSEVSALERERENNSIVQISYALPSMPTSYGHVREHAQITDDDSQITQRKVSVPKQPIGILQAQHAHHQLHQPHASTAIPLKPILKSKLSTSSLHSHPPTAPPPPPPMSTSTTGHTASSRSPHEPQSRIPRAKLSKASLRSVDTTHSHRTPSGQSSAVKLTPLAGSQILHPRSSAATLASSNTPAKLVKKTRRPSNSKTVSKAAPSPGLSAAVERQFGEVGSKGYGSASSRTRYAGAENFHPAQAARGDEYDTGGSGRGGRGERDVDMEELNAEAMGSKRMVDAFLTSRRRRVAGSEEESGAFI